MRLKLKKNIDQEYLIWMLILGISLSLSPALASFTPDDDVSLTINYYSMLLDFNHLTFCIKTNLLTLSDLIINTSKVSGPTLLRMWNSLSLSTAGQWKFKCLYNSFEGVSNWTIPSFTFLWLRSKLLNVVIRVLLFVSSSLSYPILKCSITILWYLALLFSPWYYHREYW